MLNKAIVQDSDHTAQTFSGSKVYAVRTVSRDYQADDLHVIIRLGSHFLVSTLPQSTLVRISLSITSEEPAREWSVVKIINYRHGQRDKVL